MKIIPPLQKGSCTRLSLTGQYQITTDLYVNQSDGQGFTDIHDEVTWAASGIHVLI